MKSIRDYVALRRHQETITSVKGGHDVTVNARNYVFDSTRRFDNDAVTEGTGANKYADTIYIHEMLK